LGKDPSTTLRHSWCRCSAQDDKLKIHMKIERPKSIQPMPKNAKLVFKGKVFDVYQWEQELFDGSKTIFEKVKRADTVQIIPVTEDGKILMIDETQPGKNNRFVGIPGGRMDEGESPEDVARRELLEETGYAAEELVLWISAQPQSKTDWAVYVFIGKRCRKVSEPSLDSGEKIELKSVNFDQFLDITFKKEFQEEHIAIALVREGLKKDNDSEQYGRLKNFFTCL